jgi:hypothetical protein
VLTGIEKTDAITAMIEKTKTERRVKKSSNDLLGIAQSCMTLCLIYVRQKYFTDAEIEINRCSRYVKKIDVLMVNDSIALNDVHLKELRVSLQWNSVVIETALMKVANASKMIDLTQMAMGPERRESTYALLKNLVQEQNNYIEMGNFNEGFLIEINCITLIRDIDNEESGNVEKTRELLDKTMAHSRCMLSEHGAKIHKKTAEAFKELHSVLDLQNLMCAAMGRL